MVDESIKSLAISPAMQHTSAGKKNSSKNFSGE
jgi:hypothetical protein